MFNPDKLKDLIEEVSMEVSSACEKHAPLSSLHEAYAVLLEEVDELWEEVKKNPRKHPDCRALARREAIQVAAMALRLLHDVL